ncbi:MAG: glycosyltransferase family 4 protein, partial [Limisphaerales bacterium]
MSLHIGLISHEYPPFPHGGIGSSNHDLAEGLVEAGHQVTVVGLYPKDKLSIDVRSKERLKIVRLPQSPKWLRFRMKFLMERWRLRRWLEAEHARNPFDLIEFSDYSGWLPWGGPKGVPTVARLQGTNFLFDHELKREGSRFEYDLEKQSLARASYWMGISDYVFRKTLDLCGWDSKPGATIPHAVDADYFSPGGDVLPEDGLIVFVNRVVPRKGVAEMVESANQVCAQYPKAKFVIIGANSAKPVGSLSYPEYCLSKIKP